MEPTRYLSGITLLGGGGVHGHGSFSLYEVNLMLPPTVVIILIELLIRKL
jgi:hypothetical protein